MNFQDKYIGIVGLGKSGYWSAKLAKSLDYNVFISTTKLDSQGITMLEAMSCGLLVSSIDNSSKKEFIIDMKTGILGETPKQLADKILEVTSDQNLFENITLSGRKSMEEIDVKITCKEELDILKKIANKK